MNFENSLREGKCKKVMVNKIRALSLIKSSKQAIETAKTISLNIDTSKTILRELYEGLRECCEAIGYFKGYKFLDHESIGYFLRDVLNLQSVYAKFDRYRKLRNGINYYGESIDIETIREAIAEIPQMLKTLGKYASNQKKDSTILLNQIRTIDKQRIIKKVSSLSSGIMYKVDLTIKVSLGLS